jgi:tRNA pseudouridine55 synthase
MELNLQKIIEGQVLLVDKELTWTSFDVVNKLKTILKYNHGLKKLKVGHAGTLDPLATGLLIICTGKKTKIIEEIQSLEKEYIAEIVLGATTPSYDLETEINAEFPTEHITKEVILSVLESFEVEQDQIPPVFSAKRINGKRAYDYARKGVEIELKPKRITIKKCELLSYIDNKIEVKVVCSKGTYIRALARDIGEKLSSGAYLSNLRRTRIGHYTVDDSSKINIFEKIFKNM